jgi:DNA polymerase-3 subunit gamma/tau
MRRALYREYRPRSLSEVVGQSHITSVLEKSLQSSKVSHAYLFIGPRGTGKTSVARILAHEINGFAYELENEHLDIIEIDAASNTGVDNIRSLRENAIVAPTKGKYKIYIIDEVHMLSKSAFNALLKTLEEPPAHVIFIMATTDAHKVPITITSRSQTYVFKLADINTIVEHLANIAKTENVNITTDALKVIARRGGGSFRDSISLLDQISSAMSGEITKAALEEALGLPSDELINEILDSYSSGNTNDIKLALQEILEQGIKPETIAEDMIVSIVANPKPVFLPLLDQLINTSSSNHPEVKLLLALLSTVSAQTPVTPPAPEPQITPPSPSASTPPSSTPPTPKPQPTTPSTPTQTNISSWTQLLETIKKDNSAIHSLLARATGHYEQNTLKILIKNKMVRSKIEQKLKYLASLLPEDTIIEITDQPLVSDKLITDLSSIFGDVEEVEL